MYLPRKLYSPSMSDDYSDHIDAILAQWRRERPDLDLAPMAIL